MSLAAGRAVSGTAAPLPALALIRRQRERDSGSCGVTKQLRVWVGDHPLTPFSGTKRSGQTESVFFPSFTIFTSVPKTDDRGGKKRFY